ncbi:multiple sugar transport system substrate-binding protein [Arthrobacter pascens]|uniref:ABC transporter substrate-binding protein n=1 Tax=Arthrobacter pascens TaxID=1677 RepID=UPI00277FEE21|nr:sugar ABC transporter substrate-binding protein [Arthrobacter pascens]MDQ0636195.1 multiple sugar transport system substrate-binding protein [Arthrobacter pascens]
MKLLETNVSRRNVLAGLGASAVGIITLTACGGSNSPSSSSAAKDFVMTVWGGDPDKAAYQARLDLAKAKYPDYNITLQIIPNKDYAQKVQTMISGGTGPDIMQVAEDANAYSSKNQLLPLDDYISKASLDLPGTFGPVAENWKYKDKTYAVPDRAGAMILYYNKGEFDKKGLKAPTADWTWDDLLSTAKELTGNGVFGYGGTEWWPIWMSFAYQNGGQVIDASTGKPSVNSPEVIEALQFCQDLIFKHKVVPSKVDYANMGAGVGGDAAFASGKVMMNSTGFWNIGSLAKQDKITWDVAPIWRGKDKAISAFGSGLAISRSSKNPADAFKIIQFMTSAEGQQPILQLGQDVPARQDLQKSQDFLKPSWLKGDVNMQVFPDSTPSIFKPPFIPEWNEMQKAITDAMADFWLGKSDAKATAADLQKRLDSIVKA